MGDRFNGSRKLQAHDILEKLEANSHRKKAILFVGAGNGVDVPYYLPSFENITILDSSHKMIEKAKKKIGLKSNLHFVVSDFLSWRDASQAAFDVIVLHFCLSMTTDPKAVLHRCATLLEAGGILSIMDNAKPQKKSLFGINGITKFTMFDMSLDLDELDESTGLQKIFEYPLEELSLFKRVAYTNEV